MATKTSPKTTPAAKTTRATKSTATRRPAKGMFVAVPAELEGKRVKLDLEYSTDGAGVVRVHKAGCVHAPAEVAALRTYPKGRLYRSLCCKPAVLPR